MHQGIKPKVEESSKHEDPSLLSLQILKKNERAKLLANYESTRTTKWDCGSSHSSAKGRRYDYHAETNILEKEQKLKINHGCSNNCNLMKSEPQPKVKKKKSLKKTVQ